MKAEIHTSLIRKVFFRIGSHSIHPQIVLVSFCLLLFCQGITSRGLWASHEARAAQNAQTMLNDGNWLMPYLYDGQPELQKPPAFYWLVAAVGVLCGGVDAVAVRVPAVVAGTLMVLLIWGHLHRRGRPLAGILAGVFLASAVHFTGTARIGRIDVPLACVVTAIVLFSRDSIAQREPGNWSWRPGVWLGLLGAAALLLKGPIGIVLPVVAIAFLWLAEHGSIRRHLTLASVGCAIALMVAGPWYWWANAATDGEFFRVFFLYHHMNRAFGGAEALAGHPWWYYAPRFALDFLPWSPLLVIALVQRRWRDDADARFGLIWLLAMVAVLSVSRFKRADYLLPAYAGAAIFLGCAVERWYQERSELNRKRLGLAFISFLAVVPIGWLVFDRTVTAREEAARDHAPFATQVRETAPVPCEIVLFRVESHSLAFHLGRPIHTLVEWDDLNVRLKTPGPHFIVTRAELLDELRANTSRILYVLARTDDSGSVRLKRPLVLLRVPGDPCPTQPKD